MSWAEEDWTVGLSGKVLQKVKELQVHHERLSRENKQKQLQLDNIQTSLEKQTAKYEEVRVELQSSHRELQRVQDESKAALTSKERLSQDLQSKQAQVCSLEGQLDAARSLTNKLTQEVKRLEAELEKLQNSSSVETTLFSTPCWSASPWETSGSRKEDRHGNREEGNSQGLHVRRLQFSDMPPSTSPRQQPSSARRLPDAAPSAAFPWERDDAQPSARRPSAGPSPRATNGNALSRQEQSVKTNGSNQTDPAVNELRIRLSDLEEELRVKMQTLNTIQNKVAQNDKELSAKESSLQRLRDELSQTQTRVTQERERASTAEQKAKHVQEELKCQRQNAESSRVQHLQRTKELEKQHQRDLQEFQKERQFMERQHQQDINKLNQELSQARAQHNVLQAQLEKESVHKQSLVKELEALKEKLKWTEGQLQHSQKKEAQAQAKIVEASREAEALTASLKQSQKKEKSLEDDGRRLTEERDNARCLLRELQEQKDAITPVQPSLQICAPVQTFSNASLYQTRKPSPTHTAKQKREKVDRPLEIKVPYPTDREPGEGIDSEHLSDNLFIKSEDLQREGCESKTKREDVFEDVQTHSSQTISHGSPSKQKDLLAENAALRSELQDTREELQKRLDDLETQRRAETEARTRLKQLSRKNASQVTEKEEQNKECKSQLEKERSEVERLKKALAASETLTIREGEKCDEKNGENNSVLQDKVDEMIELNMELKKQLSEVKAQLVLEREERKQHKAEMMNKESADMEKIEGLQSEIEQLKANLNDSSQMVKGPSATNSPVTYLTLREDEDSDAVDNRPETLSSCMVNNQQNAMSLVLGHLIPDEGTIIDPQHPVLTVTDLEKQIQNQNIDEPSNNLESYDKLSSLESQVLSLQKQNALEKERAHEYQIKLEILQNQVTQQTQQLTMAFEMQSKHISGLLTELQEKENSIILKEEEMQLCRQELSVLKDQVGKDDGRKRDRLEDPDTSSTCPKSCFDETSELTPAAQTPATADCQLLTQGLVNEANPENLEETDLPKDRFTEQGLQSKRLSLQQENSLLQLKIKSITTQKVPGINMSCGSALKEQMPTVLSDVSVQTCTEAQQSGKEPGSQQLDQISYLQQQVVALQTKLQVLCEENQQKTEELAVWRLCSEPCALTEPQPVTLLREDEILLSCSSNKLQGRTLFSRLQTNQISEMKTLHPFSTLQEHNKNNSQSDKENTAPAPENQRDDGKNLCRGLEPFEDQVKSVGSQTEPELQPLAQEEVTEPEKEPVSATAAVHCSKDAISTAAFPISADPATLAERIRRSRAQLSAAFDDTEYEPYGLPEVVMKGFADIPTGPSCPYIVRRGLLGTAAVPVFPKNMPDAEETD